MLALSQNYSREGRAAHKLESATSRDRGRLLARSISLTVLGPMNLKLGRSDLRWLRDRSLLARADLGCTLHIRGYLIVPTVDPQRDISAPVAETSS